MKKSFILLILIVVIAFCISATAFADYDPNVDYMDAMIKAAQIGDEEAGHTAEQARNEKIADLGLDNVQISYDDLYLLGKIICWEAGSDWLSDEWKLCVGEVVLNRVASPEFPNTIEEVVYQKGQYSGSGGSYFQKMNPSESCLKIALRLLQGERMMEESVVYQAKCKQGSGVHLAFYDSYYGWTYMCYSAYPSLYED